MKQHKPERQAGILAALERSASLRVAELAKQFAVSTETIRRDLDELTEQGSLDRTYGGAIRPLSSEPFVSERHMLFAIERQRIAQAACELVRGSKILMIGAGSTTLHVAYRLATEFKNLTVITHSLDVAAALAVNSSIKVLLLPGEFLAGERSVVGAHTVAFLQGLYADYTILGASGLTEDGPSDALLESGAVYTAMIARAVKTVIVADHSKFNLIFASRYATWRQVSALVTDQTPDAGFRQHLQQQGVVVSIV